MATGNVIPAKIQRMNECDFNYVLEILIENKLENWSYEDLISEIQRPDSVLLISKLHSEVVGFCIARLIKSNSINTYTLNDFINECEIYNFAVKNHLQKCGIGKKMLDNLVLIAKKHQTQAIWLEVRSSNFNAINFYQTNKFLQIYRRKNFYTNPCEDAIVMKRNLQ